VTEIDLDTVDGRRLHAYSVGSGPFAVMWHHGTPNVGAPPEPLFAAADREVKEANAAVEADPDFLPADWAALEGEWGWFGGVVVPALANGPGPLIDDDLAYVVPWGFDPATIGARTLLVHGAGDRVVPGRPQRVAGPPHPRRRAPHRPRRGPHLGARPGRRPRPRVAGRLRPPQWAATGSWRPRP
jgi:hypothetical protein